MSKCIAFAGSFLGRAAAPPPPPRLMPARQLFTSPVVRMAAAAGPRRMPAIIRPMVPSQALLDFVEDRAQPRAAVLKSLSQYVKQNGLQDPSNKKMVLCDAKLQALFGVDQCTILEMSKYITPHLTKPELAGGKYIAEAEELEKQYLVNQEKEAEQMKKSGVAPKARRQRRSSSSSAIKDQEKGRRLFKPVVLSEDLSAICRGQKEMPRQQIVKAVWDYIRLNNLQGKPGEPIRCDFLLKKVFYEDSIDVKTIMKGIGAHVTKKE